MFDSFNNCLIVVRYGFNLVFVVRMVLDVRLNWLYDVKKVQRHPIHPILSVCVTQINRRVVQF
jgi:hypothetical protein